MKKCALLLGLLVLSIFHADAMSAGIVGNMRKIASLNITEGRVSTILSVASGFLAAGFGTLATIAATEACHKTKLLRCVAEQYGMNVNHLNDRGAIRLKKLTECSDAQIERARTKSEFSGMFSLRSAICYGLPAGVFMFALLRAPFGL